MSNSEKGKILIKGTIIYAIGTFGTKILSFLIVPLYTYYIEPADLGVYDILMSTISLLTPLITMQISDAAFRWLLRKDGNNELYIRSTLQVLFVNCTIAAILIVLVNQFFTIPYGAYFVIILVLSRSLQTFQKLLRGLGKQKLFAISGIVYTIVFLGCNVIQICILKHGVNSLFQSAIVANICAIAVVLLLERTFRVNLLTRPDVSLIKSFLKFSVPLVPNYLNWWVINASDRYIVLLFLGTTSNGILAIAHKFPTVLQTVMSLFTTSWQDLTVGDTEKNTGEFYTKTFRLLSRVSLSMLWIIVPATKVIILWIMNERYKSACDFVAFYYLGMVFQAFSSFYGVGYLRNKQTNKAFSTSVYGAIINAVINVSLIHFIGLQAAAISTFVGFFVMWIVREKQNREELKIRVNWSEVIILTFIASMISTGSIILNFQINVIITLFGIIAFFVYNYKDILCISNKYIQRIKRRPQIDKKL